MKEIEKFRCCWRWDFDEYMEKRGFHRFSEDCDPRILKWMKANMKLRPLVDAAIYDGKDSPAVRYWTNRRQDFAIGLQYPSQNRAVVFFKNQRGRDRLIRLLVSRRQVAVRDVSLKAPVEVGPGREAFAHVLLPP